jgi:hypothetical protein
MSRKPADAQLRDEVRELTQFLRNDESFSDLRELLASHGISPLDTVLGGLIEREDESRYGFFVVNDAYRCFIVTKTGELSKWEETNAAALSDDFDAVDIALTMMRNGEIT